MPTGDPLSQTLTALESSQWVGEIQTGEEGARVVADGVPDLRRVADTLEREAVEDATVTVEAATQEWELDVTGGTAFSSERWGLFDKAEEGFVHIHFFRFAFPSVPTLSRCCLRIQ
jgi:hypothetical protein